MFYWKKFGIFWSWSYNHLQSQVPNKESSHLERLQSICETSLHCFLILYLIVEQKKKNQALKKSATLQWRSCNVIYRGAGGGEDFWRVAYKNMLFFFNVNSIIGKCIPIFILLFLQCLTMLVLIMLWSLSVMILTNND